MRRVSEIRRRALNLVMVLGIGGKDSSNVFGLTDSGEMILSPTSDDDPVQVLDSQTFSSKLFKMF